MIPPFRLTPRAKQDLANIARYTQKTWGREQHDTYLRGLDRVFFFLADRPGGSRESWVMLLINGLESDEFSQHILCLDPRCRLRELIYLIDTAPAIGDPSRSC